MQPSQYKGKAVGDRNDAEAPTRPRATVVRDGESTGYFFLATGEVSAHLYVAPGSHVYVGYSDARKELLRKAFEMEEIQIPASSVFIVHGFVQHGESVWRGSHCFRYHTYRIPQSHNLPDLIPFGYGESIEAGLREDPLSMVKAFFTEEAEWKLEPSEKEGSEEDKEGEGSNSESSNIMLESGGVPEES